MISDVILQVEDSVSTSKAIAGVVFPGEPGPGMDTLSYAV